MTIRLQRMVAEVRKMEFIIVENENRVAYLFENELIKKAASEIQYPAQGRQVLSPL